MTQGARFAAAICILDLFLKGEPLNKALLGWFRNNRFAGSKDRRAITELVYNCIRFKRSSLWPFICAGMSACGRNLLLGLLTQNNLSRLIFFDGSKFAPQTLSSKEQAVIKSFREVISKAPSPVRLDHPDFLEELLRCSLGFSYEAALECLNTRAKLFLRVNSIKCNIYDAIDLLENEQVRSIRCRNASNALLILDRVRNIESLGVLKRGKVEIQDISSQAVVDFIDPGIGINILDYCAGAGGKTLAIASLVKGKGRFFVHDKKIARMKTFTTRSKRAGFKAFMISTADLEKLGEDFDLVVSDVPCSGTGAWRRNPQGKWWLTENMLEHLVSEQRKILNSSSQLVKKGGYLAFVTCSILNIENDQQVAWFLSHHSDFILAKEKFISPLIGGDGFYVALLKKSDEN